MNLTHEINHEQGNRHALWLKECAEFEELQKIKSADALECFMICFNLRKWNTLQFCDKTGLSQTIFSKIKNRAYKEGKFPSLQSIVAICVGLQIPLDYSVELINHCGYALTSTKRDRCYKYILTHYDSFDIDKANEFLMKENFEPISDKDIYKKNFASRKIELQKSA